MTATNAVRERPILFSGAMVRALLDGTKTQTRRVVKPQPYQGDLYDREQPDAAPVLHWCVDNSNPRRRFAWPIDEAPSWSFCPYGAPGDRLWVRETWAPVSAAEEGQNGRGTLYSALPMFDGMDVFDWDWTPSIFMPRWASRLTLVIESVRVQRLQDISEDDAIAEGVECRCDTGQSEYDRCGLSAADHYANLWDSLNAKRGYSWDSNCWVWALTFSTVSPLPSVGAAE